MDKIEEIRSKSRLGYLDSLTPLTIKNLDGEIWANCNNDTKLLIIKAKKQGRLDRAKYLENLALKNAGYIVIRGLTLQEWQQYFCDATDVIKKINPGLRFFSTDDIISLLTTKQKIKLSAILAYSGIEYKFTEEELFNRNHPFPPFYNIYDTTKY